jgi:hypothetical protein
MDPWRIALRGSPPVVPNRVEPCQTVASSAANDPSAGFGGVVRAEFGGGGAALGGVARTERSRRSDAR